MENDFYNQIRESFRIAFSNAKKNIEVENKQKPFVYMKLTQATIQICNN